MPTIVLTDDEVSALKRSQPPRISSITEAYLWNTAMEKVRAAAADGPDREKLSRAA
jgi:hypothetical protein